MYKVYQIIEDIRGSVSSWHTNLPGKPDYHLRHVDTESQCFAPIWNFPDGIARCCKCKKEWGISYENLLMMLKMKDFK